MGNVNSKLECLEDRLWDIELRYASHRDSVHEVGHCKTDVRSVITRLRYTTLLEACALPDKGRSLLMVRYLLRQGEDPNGNNAVTTPLTNAMCQNNVRVFRELYAHGADVNKANNSGETPLLFAAKRGQLTAVQFLCRFGADVNQQDEEGNTPLFWTVKRRYVTATKTLCNLGADANKADEKGNTALFSAATSDNTALLKVLCANGADINKANHQGETPLYLAVTEGCVKTVEVLCQLGADVNTNRAEITPLTLAAQLLAVDTYGWLFHSRRFSCQHMAILHLLLKAGSSPSSLASHTKSPLTYALEAKERCYLTADKKHLYCECLMLMLLAGYQVTSYDYQLMNSDNLCPLLATEGVLQYAHDIVCTKPPLLQELCKISLRRSVRSPIGKYIPKTGLPERLQKYVLSERPNKVGDQSAVLFDLDVCVPVPRSWSGVIQTYFPVIRIECRGHFFPTIPACLNEYVEERSLFLHHYKRTANNVLKWSYSERRAKKDALRKINMKVPMYRSRKGHGRKNNVC